MKATDMKIRISELGNTGDLRGISFTTPTEALDFVGRVADLYLASTAPGAIRGNHYHLRKRQALMILPGTTWSFHWDDGEGTPAQHRGFDGSAAVVAMVPPGISLAVRNEGEAPLWLITCSSEPYDPTEIVARKVV
jgi:dTDP-4-dehydrorhamnose 3,5-epimerase-like enzyme